MNNRSLAALSFAEMKPTKISEVTATPELLKRLNEEPLEYHGKILTIPGKAIPVTEGKNDLTILKVIEIPE